MRLPVRMALAAVLGGIAVLGMAPFNLWPLMLAALAAFAPFWGFVGAGLLGLRVSEVLANAGSELVANDLWSPSGSRTRDP